MGSRLGGITALVPDVTGIAQQEWCDTECNRKWGRFAIREQPVMSFYRKWGWFA